MRQLGNPILIVSDNPALSGGLSRMCRDLASLCATMPEFKVGVLGRGIGQRHKFPFIVYDYPETGQWGEGYIQHAWNDLSQGEQGVIITLDDLSRRHWFVNPIGLGADLQAFLGSERSFRRWAYVPIDSTGPNGQTLSHFSADCARRYDRVLAASEFGQEVLRASGVVGSDWLPHGLWLDKFHPREVEDTPTIMVGSVMANQSRKDFPVLFEAFSTLRDHFGRKFKAWLHTDRMLGYWSVYALAADFEIEDCLEVTHDLTDDALASRYSSCACTLLPSGGEGFGYPIAESLACGTACIVGDYAAGAALVEESCRIEPACYRVDTQYNVLRAVYQGSYSISAYQQIQMKLKDREYRTRQLAQSVEHLDWNKLQHLWKRWLLEGLR